VFVLTGVTLSVAAVVAVDNQGIYPLATFTGPAGLQCAMWSSLGDTAAYCFGAIPGLNHPTNQVYAGDNQKAHFDQTTPPATDKLNGKPLASGQKVILGAGGTLMGGDQITCGVRELVIACMVSGTASSSTRKKAGRFEREARNRKVLDISQDSADRLPRSWQHDSGRRRKHGMEFGALQMKCAAVQRN
jgi:hypothetical protein